MTDIVQRAEQALDGITGGPWLHADSSYGRCNVISTIGWNVAACSDGGIGKGDPAAVMKIAARNADFIAAAPELVRGLLEELTTKIEVLDTVLASAGRYHAERDALRANLPDLLGRAWDDGNATGLDGWIGPGRGAGDVDALLARIRRLTGTGRECRRGWGRGRREVRCCLDVRRVREIMGHRICQERHVEMGSRSVFDREK